MQICRTAPATPGLLIIHNITQCCKVALTNNSSTFICSSVFQTRAAPLIKDPPPTNGKL